MYVSLITQDQQDVCEVRFVDSRILDEARIQQIVGELQQVAEQCNYLLFLNFSGVEFISSVLIGHLLLLHRRIKNHREQALVMCNVAPNVLEVFKITSLNKVVKIVADHEKALAQFQPATEEVN
jgi:anti-sigma B factor antagonist